MRPVLLLIATLSSTAALAATPIDAPARLPGLWLINTAPATEAAGVASFHVCLGSTPAPILRRPGHEEPACSGESWSKDAHYRYYRAECTVRGSQARIEARFTGDFEYNYHGELTATYSPPLDGVELARFEMDGRRLAPCKAEHPVGKMLIQGKDGVGNLNLGEPVVKLR